MTRIALLMAILLNGAAGAEPRIPTEEEKVAALRLAYILNGNSMVRWGSIDLSKPIVRPCSDCTPAPANPRLILK
jgi:hypothetical protein